MYVLMNELLFGVECTKHAKSWLQKILKTTVKGNSLHPRVAVRQRSTNRVLGIDVDPPLMPGLSIKLSLKSSIDKISGELHKLFMMNFSAFPGMKKWLR